jgi:hypothetical protein
MLHHLVKSMKYNSANCFYSVLGVQRNSNFK